MNNVKRKLISISIAVLAALTIASIGALAASTTPNLDQCGNGPLSAPVFCNGANWINGNLNNNQAHYFEGDSVPYRLRLPGLSSGTHTVTIQWDTTVNSGTIKGKHALDYLTTYNRTENISDDPCSNAGFTCSGPITTFNISVDPNVAKGADGISGTSDDITQIPGVFTLFGGTIKNVSAYTLTGTFAGASSTSITITFTGSGNMVLAWGGHISTRKDWGSMNSAVAISGSPYHMRLIDVDGSGGNQDRSLSASAVIFPGSITIIKDAIPNSETKFSFTASPLPLTNFNLTDNGTTANTTTFNNIINFTTYTVTESVSTGWTLNSVVPCSVISPNGGTQSNSNPLTINLKEGELVTCTFTNQRQQATLKVIKHVINDNGGTNVSSDFTMNVSGTNVIPSSFPGNESGTIVTLDPDTSYSVSETGPSGYTSNFSTDCSGSIPAGQNKTCTVTNDDQPGTLIVKKLVINDNGGTKQAGNFSFQVNNGAAQTFDPNGDNDGNPLTGQNNLTVNASTYNVTEPAVPGYTTTYNNCNNVVVTNGGTAICTVTNDDQPSTLIVKKLVINDNGGTKQASDFSFQVNDGAAQAFDPNGDNDGNPLTGQNNLTVNAGIYNITEPAVPGYTTTYDNCTNVVVSNGENATCTVTNNDQAATLIVIKHVINDNGGTNVSSDFTMNVSGANVTPSSFPGNDSGTTVTLDAGSYSVSETGPFGYDASFSDNCTSTIANGETKTCTVTNKNQFRHLSFTKIGALNITGKTTDYTINVTNDGDVNVTIVNVTDPNSIVSCDKTIPRLLQPSQTIYCSVSYPADTTIKATTEIEIEIDPSQPHIFWTV